MANVFTNRQGEATTGGVALYTVPANTTAVLLGCTLANKTTTAVTASVMLGSTYIVKDAPIPVGSSLSVLDGKIIATAGQQVKFISSAPTSVDCVLSAMEAS